jgi:quinol monooxygenase YgiN
MVSIIERDGKVTTLINVFTVQPKDQQRLIDLLIDTTEKVTSQQEGFISANIHKGQDGTRVVNYEQWKSKEALETMLKNPRAITYMNDVLSIAKLDGIRSSFCIHIDEPITLRSNIILRFKSTNGISSSNHLITKPTALLTRLVTLDICSYQSDYASQGNRLCV